MAIKIHDKADDGEKVKYWNMQSKILCYYNQPKTFTKSHEDIDVPISIKFYKKIKIKISAFAK